MRNPIPVGYVGRISKGHGVPGMSTEISTRCTRAKALLQVDFGIHEPHGCICAHMVNHRGEVGVPESSVTQYLR